MKGIFYIFILWIIAATPGFSQVADSSKISLSLSNSTIQSALDELSGRYAINISYQSNLPELQNPITLSINKQALSEVLKKILTGTSLTFKIIARQVVIFTQTVSQSQKLLIQGKLSVYGSDEWVSYAGIELKSARKGTISDMQGHFRMEIDPRYAADTLMVSSINFNPVKIPVSHLVIPGTHTFYLTRRVYQLPDIEVVGEKQKFEQWGNHKWISSGSFYLDTHGQQTALLIEPKETGNLVSVSFYLSKKGNTEAPFRLHVYLPDSLTGKPGTELLPEMVIVKPTAEKGWYKVNLARYKIKLPANGVFVALEGIFPGDFDFYYDGASPLFSEMNEGNNDEFDGESISYGQQIGYSGGNKNNTWHYSIDGNWFQLKKKHFNAMISAEIKTSNNKVNTRFLGWFGLKKINRT